jgi:protein FAM50
MVHVKKSSALKEPNEQNEGSDNAAKKRKKDILAKKKKKSLKKGALSFGYDDGEDDGEGSDAVEAVSTSKAIDRPQTRSPTAEKRDDTASPSRSPPPQSQTRRLGPNTLLGAPAPKVLTKAAVRQENLIRDNLRKEFIALQERIKETPMLIPFVFYDGTAIPAGTLKLNKGDPVWLFLDMARKIGARQDIAADSSDKNDSSAAGKTSKSNLKGWARVSVDDLILVRGDIIIPHHYDFYYFILNKAKGPDGRLLFPYSSDVTAATPAPKDESAESEPQATLIKAKSSNKNEGLVITKEDEKLEGFEHDPRFTKVVDRRWYERNKHIFPASIWTDFEPGRSYEKEVRRDANGNIYFFG